MSLPLQIFHVTDSNVLVAGQNSVAQFDFPPIVSGGILYIVYQALLGRGAPYEVVELASYASLKMGIYKSDGTQLAFQNSFTQNALDNTLIGELSLNGSDLLNAVATLTPDTSLTVYFTIEVTDGSGRPIHLPPVPVSLSKNLITSTATADPSVDTVATQEWARNAFIPREGDGTPQIVKSRDGSTTWLIWRDNDGVEQKQQI